MPSGTSKVRLHDDKHTYTGVHARGGPDSVPKAGSKSRRHFSLNEWTSTPPVRAMATCRALAASPWAGRIRCLVDRCLVHPVVQLGLSFLRGGCRSHKFLERPFQNGVFDRRLVKLWTIFFTGQQGGLRVHVTCKACPLPNLLATSPAPTHVERKLSSSLASKRTSRLE